MMVSPEIYINDLKDESYEKLIKERDKLVRDIKKYENRSDDVIEPCTNPSREIMYTYHHIYLAKVCELLFEKLNEIEF